MFGERLKELRIAAGLPQRKLAIELHVSQNAIYNWENNKREPTMDTVLKIARFFNVPASYLLGIDDESYHQGTMRDYMDMKGKALTEYFDAWLKVCEIEWDEVERNGKKGRLFRFEGLESFGEDEKEYFVTEAQFKKIRNGEVHFVKDKIQEYDDMNRSEEE